MPNNGQFYEFLKIWSLRSNSATRRVTFKIGQKIVENAKIDKFRGHMSLLVNLILRARLDLLWKSSSWESARCVNNEDTLAVIIIIQKCINSKICSTAASPSIPLGIKNRTFRTWSHHFPSWQRYFHSWHWFLRKNPTWKAKLLAHHPLNIQFLSKNSFFKKLWKVVNLILQKKYSKM